jgi:copper chaperone
MEATYNVSGMTCGGCARSVTNAVSLALPETTVVVSHEAGTVQVSGTHALEQVKQAVEDAGFDFGGATG